MSTSAASSKKFFKTKFRQSFGSSISSWTNSLLHGGKKMKMMIRTVNLRNLLELLEGQDILSVVDVSRKILIAL